MQWYTHAQNTRNSQVLHLECGSGTLWKAFQGDGVLHRSGEEVEDRKDTIYLQTIVNYYLNPLNSDIS